VSEPEDLFRLDHAGVRAAFDRASARYESAARLQARVAEELLARLVGFAFEPQVVLDLGAGTGRAARQLKRRYPRAQVLALDLSLGMLRQARRHQHLWRRFARVCADAQRLPLATASVDVVFSNLMLQWCQPLDAALAEVRRVLRPAGFFAFSTFGPLTLHELRHAWAAADADTHVNHFIDVHDVGDALVRAGLSEPVLDVDRLEVHYPDALALMRDLKAIGAHNVTAGRPRTLLGRARLRRMQAAYEALRHGDELPATFEVIYGAAWGAAGRPAVPVVGGEAHIAPGSIRRASRP
jgi:malonyl-CoA O-methyltransferase